MFLRSTFSVLQAAVFVWACFGFMAWELDPSEWGGWARGLAISVTLAISFWLVADHLEDAK
ncbi:hypothetical protein QHH_60 [Halomonas phage QHHSV-1]|nr:hypothetical protein QHH_60 [Halomonas phage QHHSV-1]